LKFILVLFIILLFISCKTTAPIQKSIKGNSILFLDLLFIDDTTNNKLNVELINCKITNGVIKTDFVGKEKRDNGDVSIIFTDENLNELKTFIISNPLIVDAEYVGDDKSLNRSQFKLNRNEFSMRAGLIRGTRYIIVKKINTDSKISEKEIFKIDIEAYINENDN